MANGNILQRKALNKWLELDCVCVSVFVPCKIEMQYNWDSGRLLERGLFLSDFITVWRQDIVYSYLLFL